MQAFVRLGGHHATRRRVSGVPFDDAMDRKCAAEWTAVVKAMDQIDDVAEAFRERCRVEMLAVHQFGDERADAFQHAEHTESDSELGGTLRGLRLVGPIDSEQFGARPEYAPYIIAVVGGVR